MEINKIEKQEVHFIWDSFSGHYMRISAEKWYEKRWNYLISPFKIKDLEDAFQEKQEALDNDDPNTHTRAETTDLQHANYESIKKLKERLNSVEADYARADCVQLFLDKANERISGLEERVRHLEGFIEELEKCDRVTLINRLVERLTLVEDYIKLTRKYGKNEKEIHIKIS